MGKYCHSLTLSFFLPFFLFETVSCRLGWPWIYHVLKVGLELLILQLMSLGCSSVSGSRLPLNNQMIWDRYYVSWFPHMQNAYVMVTAYEDCCDYMCQRLGIVLSWRKASVMTAMIRVGTILALFGQVTTVLTPSLSPPQSNNGQRGKGCYSGSLGRKSQRWDL